MRAALFTGLLALMCFLIAVVVLTARHGGPDVYYGGSLSPVHPDPSDDPLLTRLIPAEMSHPCPACGPCVHAVDIVESQRSLTIRDHHRWFQLLHAADRTYYFDDLVQFAGGYKNRSARDQTGTWAIHGRLGPAMHGKSTPHDCGSIPMTFTLNYQLIASEAPLAETTRALPGPVILADHVQALVFRYQTPSGSSVLHFVWRIAPRDPSGAFDLSPCPCGKP
jgi:hypothetical protein